MNKPRKRSQTDRDEEIGTISLFVLAGALLICLYEIMTNMNHYP